LIAFVGTLNPSASDISVFVPLEQTALTETVAAERRTSLFASYGLIGSLVGAVGALFARLPELLSGIVPISPEGALRAMFVIYALLGVAAAILYRRLPLPVIGVPQRPVSAALGPSRRIVYALSVLFSLDSFGGGFYVQSLLALWLFQHFGLSLI